MTTTRDIVLVHLDDCPHWRTADDRLREAMRRAGVDPASLRYRGVKTQDAPADFPGSPAILVDGHDAFPTALPAGPTCRRYETETGPDGAPSVTQLVSILERRVQSMTTAAQTMEALIGDGGPLDLEPDRSRIFARLIRALAGGRPLARDDVARLVADLELTPADAHAFLERWTERDREAHVVGLGITLTETPHRYTTNGTSLFTWCALDTLVLPRILEDAGEVASRSPGSTDVTRLEVTSEGVTNVDPPGAVISLPRIDAHEIDTTSVEGIWRTLCHRSYFFPSRGEGERWARTHEGIGVASLDEAADDARRVADRILAHGS